MAALGSLITKITGGDSGSKRTKIGEGTEAFLIDVTTSTVATYEAELTSNPVERGVNVTDHIIIKPKKVDIEGIISDEPLQLRDKLNEKTLIDEAKGAIGAIGGAVASRLGANGVITGATTAIGGFVSGKLISSAPSISEQIKASLIKILEGKQTVSLKIGKKNFPNMVMTSLKFPRDAQLGQAVKFSASFVEIRKVVTTSVPVTKSESNASEAEQLGHQNAKPADDPTKRSSSVMLKGFQFAGAFTGPATTAVR